MATTPKSKTKAANSNEAAAPRAAKPAQAKPAKVLAPKAQSNAVAAATNEGLLRRRVMVGTVTSDKMQKTIVVRIDRRVKHAFYKKYVGTARKFKAHDEKNDAKVGDIVELIESKPMSREKRWALKSIIRRATQSLDANV